MWLKDINIINRILKEEKYISRYYYYINVIRFFCSVSIPLRGEKATWNTLKKGCDSIFYLDALRMYAGYYNCIGKELKKNILYDGFTKYNHDVLSKVITQLKNTNIGFTYTPEELSLKDSIKGYDFILPKDSDTLNVIGNELNNCVAGYKMRVLEKSCIIVYVKKDNKIVLCIEVRNNTIIQQRAKNNSDPNLEERKVLDLWSQKHKLYYNRDEDIPF